MRFSFLLPLLAAVPSWSLITSPQAAEVALGRRSVTEDASQIFQKRAARTKCSVPLNPSNGQRKRELWGLLNARDDPERNVTMLEKRTMTLPTGPDNMNEFMVEEIDTATWPIIWSKGTKKDPQDIATSIFREFANRAFSFATGHLCGCTTMVLISRKGVYIGHFWENISFNPDQVWLDALAPDLEGDAALDKCFQDTVIKGMTSGIRNGKEQVSLKNNVAKLDDDNLRGYLMIPQFGQDGTTTDPYRNRWNQMRAKVAEFIPKMADASRWKEQTYDALNNDDAKLDTTSSGKILFKYDPDHNGQKKATLWIESNLPATHDDTWT